MTLMGKSNPLGSSTCAYLPNTILFDGNNGASTTLTLKRGCYYVRAQGAGAGGGNSGARRRRPGARAGEAACRSRRGARRSGGKARETPSIKAGKARRGRASAC